MQLLRSQFSWLRCCSDPQRFLLMTLLMRWDQLSACRGFRWVGTGHTYQLLDRRLSLSLFSMPDTFRGLRDHKTGAQWRKDSFVIETSLLSRQRVLTIPTFPRFLGKEAMVTLRREDGCPREKRAVREIPTSSALPRAAMHSCPAGGSQTPKALTWKKNHLLEITVHSYSMSPNLWFII